MQHRHVVETWQHTHFSSALTAVKRAQTLLKPNGGFLFDGNKALVELECKCYKTIIEETVQLPTLSTNYPFPMVHTSPFSVGGFAWQVCL